MQFHWEMQSEMVAAFGVGVLPSVWITPDSAIKRDVTLR